MHARRVYIQVFPIIFIIAVEYLLVATRCSICRVSLFSLVFVRLLYLSCSLAIVRSFLPSLCHASVVQLFPTDGFSLFLLCRSCVMSLFCLLIVVIVSSCRRAPLNVKNYMTTCSFRVVLLETDCRRIFLTAEQALFIMFSLIVLLHAKPRKKQARA